MRIKKSLPTLVVSLALLALALMSLPTTSTLVAAKANPTPYVQTSNLNINIPSVTCSSSGQTCSPPFTTSVNVLAGTFEVQFTPSSQHCSSMSASINVDNGTAQQTAVLGPGVSSVFLNFGTVTAGVHNISVQGIGQTGGCNTGALLNWMGAITVRANFPTPVYNECLQDDSNRGYIVRFNASTGAYEFTTCANGVTVASTGTVSVKGSVITIQEATSTRRMVLKLDRSTRRGTASLQIVTPAKEYVISDRNYTDNTCTCP
ncbi:MAG: hypothetical protein HY231_17560 [Acidobacteria bacterium]|nr:hypothetical protein [Acidobacteriota bacterium]